MIFSGWSWAKFFGGFNIFSGAVLGKIVYFLIIISVCLGIFWKVFIAPSHNQNQQAESITNITEQQDEGFSLIKIKILGWGN
jgi:hypothetical protein